jgi:hypothetical protein
LLICLAGCGGRQPATPPVSNPLPVAGPRDWRAVATAADRDRMRRWRDAWSDGLAQAQRADAAAVAAQGALFAPDAALDDPIPPAGAYRCRTFKLGSPRGGGSGFVAYGWFDCRVTTAANGAVRLVKLSGSQRQMGVVYPAAPTRAAFLGTLMLGDEVRAYAYGVDRTRDVAGWIERVGTRRWRVAMPYPAFESVLDVLELVPAE